MIRVLVAEDSVTVRELLVAILESDPGMTVVGQAKNGVEAVELAKRLRPNVITMDVHMPLMDGFEATREIMVQAPTPIIIISSSSSERDVELSLHALRAGALMVVAKPDDPGSPQFDGRQGQFRTMVKAMADVKVVRRWAERAPRERVRPGGPVAGRPTSPSRLVAIAASTGGPAALQRILGDLPTDFPAPILVVQHIARGFVSGLADWLNTGCSVRVRIAQHGEPLVERTAFLAPDDRHLGVGRHGRLVVDDSPAIKGFRPSASRLFESAAQAYGSAVAAVILTGMGDDGVAGLPAVKAAGGYVIAQDEGTSVVYGMPREAIAAGVVDAVLAVDDIAPRLAGLTQARERRS